MERKLSFYEDGTLKSSTGFLDGKLEGQKIEYYSNGIQSSITNFHQGRKQGIHLTYHLNGAPSSKGYFDNDRMKGEFYKYSPSGFIESITLISEEEDSKVSIILNENIIQAGFEESLFTDSIPSIIQNPRFCKNSYIKMLRVQKESGKNNIALIYDSQGFLSVIEQGVGPKSSFKINHGKNCYTNTFWQSDKIKIKCFFDLRTGRPIANFYYKELKEFDSNLSPKNELIDWDDDLRVNDRLVRVREEFFDEFGNTISE